MKVFDFLNTHRDEKVQFKDGYDYTYNLLGESWLIVGSMNLLKSEIESIEKIDDRNVVTLKGE